MVRSNQQGSIHLEGSINTISMVYMQQDKGSHDYSLIVSKRVPIIHKSAKDFIATHA